MKCAMPQCTRPAKWKDHDGELWCDGCYPWLFDGWDVTTTDQGQQAGNNGESGETVQDTSLHL